MRPPRFSDGMRRPVSGGMSYRRVDRAEFRALLRHRRDEANTSARAREHSEAAFDSPWRVQSESDFPLSVGIGYSTGVEKPTALAYFCVFLAIPSLLGTCAPHTLFFLVARAQTASESSLSQIQIPPRKRTGLRHGLLVLGRTKPR